MITLSKNGNAIRFTFVDNGHYLFNGTIDVPINSLSLITDESEMATFKKSATNDTFISALYSDFGMSKSELETWYMNNMVGSSGSGSGGTTPEEVQQMIDESISGLAESSAVTLEISEAVSGKADSDSLATVATSGSYNDLLDKPTIPDVSNYFDGAEYDSGTTRINFYHGSTVKAYIDASAFIVDGMIDDVRIETISGNSYLVIDFNTASGKEDIQIPLTDIFDPSNYYTKSEVDDAISAATDDMATQTWVGEQGYLTEHQSLSAYSTTQEVNTAIEEATSGKADTSAVTAVNNVLTAHTADTNIHVTTQEKSTWNAKSDFSGSYNDLTDKPTITSAVTSASTDSEIPTAKAVYDATQSGGGGGTTYSAGTGINIDSANTITAVYRGYLSLDNPQSNISEYSGQFYLKAPWIDCSGTETGLTNFYVTSEDNYVFSFNSTTKQYSLISYPSGKENDWQDYFTIEWDNSVKMFKITTLQEVYSISDNACTRLFRIGNEYNDYSFKYSGTTEDAFDGIADNFNNYFKSAYFGATSNSLEMNLSTGTKQSPFSIKLEEIDGSNSTLKPNIIVGTGVSGWTEVQMNGCGLDGEVGTPIFRMSGDTSDLSNFDKNSFNTQWYLEIENYGSAGESVFWNGEDFVLYSQWFGDDGDLGTATVTYDDVQNTLTIAYPLTVSPYGYDMKVKLNNFYSNNCQFGTNITKFEYFSEVMQPLKPYIQETRAEVANKVPTSAITSAVTSASTDSEIPSAKAVYDAIGQGGGGGITSGEVQTMIDESISGKADTSAVTTVNDVLTAHIADTTIHVTSADKTAWNAKSDFSGSYNDLTDKPTIPTVPTSNTAFTNDAGYITEDALSGYAESSAVTEEIAAAVSGKVDTTTYTAYTAATDTLIGGKASQSDLETVSGAVANKQDTLVSGTNIKTINNQSLLGSGNITIQGGGSGSSTIELTQAEYDALVSGGTVDPTTYYIITDATPIDMSNYYTSAQTDSAISAATSGLQETLVSGTNIKTINNESLLGSGNITIQGGGGTTYSAGTNIDITNDTISCTLPIYYTVGYKSIKSDIANVSGERNIAWGNTAYVGRKGSSYTPSDAFAFGYYVNTYNSCEASFGQYNVSNQNTLVGGASGTTLFSVGNGTSSARHNAFEIRQNGDIYITSGGTDIKLQDNLGGGSVSSAVTSGDTNAVSSDAVYTAMGGLKLQQITQADYDALVSGGTVDSSTLYIITNVVN